MSEMLKDLYVNSYSNALKSAEQELVEAVAALSQAQARAQALEQRIADLKMSIAGLAKLCEHPELNRETTAAKKWHWTAEQKARHSDTMKSRWAAKKQP